MTELKISASQVKELRDKTGAGMGACKKALVETAGDVEAAVDVLRKKGVKPDQASRTAAEGAVLFKVSDCAKHVAVVELRCETDFAARNENFQAFVGAVAGLALDSGGDFDALQATAYPGGGSVTDRQTELVSTIGENIHLRRCTTLSVENGVVASYMHGAMVANQGRIGVLVALESTGDKAALESLGKQIAMHVAAARTEVVSVDDIDAATLDRERNVLADQARASGKPEEIVEKMVEGRLRKYYEEVALLEQVFVVDGETKVSKVLEAAAGDVGAPVAIAGFLCFALGEGVEKEETDFAAEVAAQVAG